MIDTYESGADLVVPWRKDRVDPEINQKQSRLFNRVVQKTTNAEFRDLSCPYRIIRKEILSNFHMYGDLCRYLPIMAKRGGYRVVEVHCAHQAEEGKEGVYALREYVGRIADFLTFHFDLFSSRKPLRYFGKRALYFLAPGIVLTLLLVAGAALNLFQVGKSHWLILALVLLLLGSMIWSVGLLGEIIAFAQGRHRKDYRVEKVVD